MVHPIHRVTGFSVAGPYTLTVSFADGTEQTIDFQPVLHGVMLGPLRELTVFNAVSLDDEVGTLVWPNGADFDPATLHDWPRVKDEFAKRARSWRSPNQERANKRMEPTRRRGGTPRGSFAGVRRTNPHKSVRSKTGRALGGLPTARE